MCAMQAMTIDALAGGGRMIVGIGVSGPQIVEGWYGQPWGKPNARLRDYVEILRAVLRREGPVTHDGPEITLPYTGPGALGQGKPLRSILHPPSDIPIWLASVGPRNTALCAELCEGWLPMGLPPQGTDDPDVAGALDAGFARRTDGRGPADFDVFNGLTVKITDDVKGWLDRVRRTARRTWGAWAASRTTTTSSRWRSEASRQRRRASRSCSSPVGATKRSRPCPTKRCSRARSWARRPASGTSGKRAAWCRPASRAPSSVLIGPRSSRSSPSSRESETG